MLTTYLKIALRNILRYKSFSVINILGLTIGLTAFLAISLYVVDELSYDKFNANAGRIYRTVLRADFDGQVEKWAAAPNLLVPTAVKEIPEIEKGARILHHNFGDLAFINTEENQFSESLLFFADADLLDILTIPLTKGDQRTALRKPNTAIVSASSAKKYFGDTDPLGKTLRVDNSVNLEITGVYNDLPANSSFQANIIGSFEGDFWFNKNMSWGNASFRSFFLLQPSASPTEVDNKIETMLTKNIAKEERWFTLSLQPLLDVHLHSGDLNASFDRGNYGNMMQVRVLMALCIIILFIAAVNDMNLTTAQSQRRNKEVGINKTLGASFGQLSTKFYFEAGLFVAISMGLSLIAFSLVLPTFNSISGKSISSDFLFQGEFWLGFIAIWFVLTLLSGFYPAWYLSSFSPKAALQKTAKSGGQALIRKSLVVVQFASSVTLIICAVVFYKQMNYIQNKKLGYSPEQVVAVRISGAKTRESIATLKTEYEKLADVISVARSQSYPSQGASGRNISREGDQTDGISLATARASAEILETLNIKLLAGTTLPQDKNPNDTTVQVVLNKTAIDYLGYTPEQAIGRKVNCGFQYNVEVVGVMEDFHYASLHQKIGAYCFHNARTEGMGFLLVKVNTGNLTATLKQLENTFKKNIDTAFDYGFIDQQMATLYQAEQNMAGVVLIFAGLAIFIACLGLYALAAFTAEQRTKEIGIRKVMGASVPQLIGMLSKDFLILVGVAFIVGIPAGYYFMNRWLEGFAYRTQMDFLIFVVAGFVSLAIAWITVSIESFKAANSNPVKSLRSE